MGVNKVEYGSSTLVDLTGDTVTPETLLQGETAHNAAGNRITGTARPGVQSFNGRSGSVLPIAGDYSAEQVNYDSNKTVKQVIDALATKETSDITGQQNQLNAQGVLGAKNLLKYPYHHVSGIETPVGGSITYLGVTYTVNDDYSITANGTATGSSYFIFNRKQDWNDCDLYGKKIKIIVKPVVRNTFVQLYDTDNSKTLFRTDASSGAVEFTFPDSLKNNVSWNISLNVLNRNTVSNVIFKTMITLASDPDDTYQPYAMTNRELTEELTVKQSGISTSLSAALNVLRKYGKVVTFSFQSTNTTGSAGDEIGIIPDGFRPANDCTILAGITDGGSKRIIIAPNSGKVTFADAVTNTTLTIHTTWITS